MSIAASVFLTSLLLGRIPPVRSSQDIPKSGGTLRIRTLDTIAQPNLDPAAGVSVLATEQIFDGLVKLDNSLDPVPALAEYWRPEDDGRKTVFFLRKGVRFHDGRELTSEDVKFSLERLLQPDFASPVREFLSANVVGALDFRKGKAGEVAGFRTPEKSVFEIQWLTPNVTALYLLSTSFCKILPKNLVLEQGRNFFWKPVGTGVFKFDSWLRSPRLDIVGVRIVRNEAYFGKKAWADAFEISALFTVDHFMNEETDVMPYLTERLARSGCQVIDGGPQNITYLVLSCQVAPLNRMAIRQAVALGIDREALAAAGQESGFIQRATRDVIPDRWPGFFPRYKEAGYNPERARQIIEEQGFGEARRFPECVLFLPLPRTDGQRRFAAELERQLDNIGIPSSVSFFASLAEARDARRPFFVKVDWPLDWPDPESIVRPLFQSQSGLNVANHWYDSPRMDGLLEEAAMERSISRRTELFRRMEEVLGEDVPALPLYIGEPRVAIQPYVRGVKASSRGYNYLDLREVWLEKKEPAR